MVSVCLHICIFVCVCARSREIDGLMVDIPVAVNVWANFEGQRNTTFVWEGSDGIIIDSRNSGNNGFETVACIYTINFSSGQVIYSINPITTWCRDNWTW
jgi:hypothetical protein